MGKTLQTAAMPSDRERKQPMLLALAALGVVYGDIGTSTLYGLKQAVEAGGTPTPESVLGIVSVILWSLLLVVGLKYAILILRADNHGEGGIVALLALLDARRAPRGSWRASLLIVGLIGAALLYGDGVITPAISVLSAVEGLRIDAPRLAPIVVPITVAILVGLFLVQHKGTEFIGNIFGPVMLVWFVAIGLLGLIGIMRAPGILAAISPYHAVFYLVHAGPGIAFAVLGAAFLALTGAEAMYADMGHFGRSSHPTRLVFRRAAGTDAQLFRPRRIASRGPPCGREPVLLARTQVGALSDGCVRDHGHRDRLAINHLRCVLPHPAGDATRLLASHAGATHGQPREGSDLHTRGELASGRGHARSRDHFWLIRRTRRRLRHRRLDADGGHDDPCRPGRAAMGLQPAPGRLGQRVLPRDRADLRYRQHDEADRGWLVPASLGRRHCVPDADLANRVAVAGARTHQAAPA